MMHLEKVLEILEKESVGGSPTELEALCTRIGDLVRMNGEDWVKANRKRLLREWDTILKMKLIR
ncbi:MAG: hypothetical protein QNI89_19810 [Desulfobacterales bacterium]|nr:hypothetical protein [Desulfobacterales bacterium]MDJ0856250.1 hypothetical protein [Desulfobacterales bacterium]MDJ0889553.1 hypothetical protein [Desulfobacterales bacterium]